MIVTEFLRLSLVLSLILCGLSLSAVAAPSRGYVNDSGVLIEPTVNIGLGFDDNFLNQYKGTTSSSFFTLAPSLLLSLDSGVNQYEARMGLASGVFEASHLDRYLKSNLNLQGHFAPNSHTRWRLSGDFQQAVEQRGTGITIGRPRSVSSPVEYNELTGVANYEYGALSGHARLALAISYYNRRYTNFKALTEIRDHDSLFVGSTAYYSVSPKSDAFFKLNQNTIRYSTVDTDGFFRDSHDIRALLGFQWEVSAVTAGRAEFGYQLKNFYNSSRDDFSGASWELELDWRPLSYSRLSLVSSRMAKDPSISSADYLNETLVDVSWEHEWAEYYISSVGFIFSDKEYIGGTNERTDSIRVFDFSLKRVLSRWVAVSTYVQFINKKSPITAVVFNKNVVGVNAIVSM